LLVELEQRAKALVKDISVQQLQQQPHGQAPAVAEPTYAAADANLIQATNVPG
jgi:hypothetical protein